MKRWFEEVTLCLVLSVCGLGGFPLDAQDFSADPRRAEFQKHFDGGILAIQEGRYEDGIISFKRARRLDAADPVPYYNIACCYSLLGLQGKAVEWLDKAFERGFWDFEHIEADGDLDNLRDFEPYRELLTRKREELVAQLQYQVYEPATMPADKPLGVLVFLHGYGSSARELRELLEPVAEELGILVVCPQAARRVGPEGFSWQGTGDLVVLEVLDRIGKQYKIDERQLIAGGFSEGGWYAYRVGLKHPERFSGIVAIAGIYEREKFAPYLAGASKAGLAVCILHGSEDAGTLSIAEQARDDLRGAGIKVRYRLYPVGHQYPPQARKELVRAILWIQKVRSKAPSSEVEKEGGK